MSHTPERHYLLEARQILDAKDGEAMYLPEKAHLEAIEEYYSCLLIRISNALKDLDNGVMDESL